MGLAALGVSEKLNCTCPICGKKFHLKPSKVKRDKHHYCSRECVREAQKIYMRGPGNHQYGIRGSENATWHGGTKIENGYRSIKYFGHPFGEKGQHYVLEHRLVAEKYLLTEENSVEIDGKRYLKPEYIVHHKNHNRLDNRPENLEVMLKAEHSLLHSKEPCMQMPRDKKTGRFVKRDKDNEERQ